MTVVHEPSLQFLQFAAHLTPLLCKALCLCPLLFDELAMLDSSLCESRKAILGPWAGASTPMEPAAPYWELGWPLAKRASSRSGLAPCAWPVLAEACFSADSVAFGKHFKHPNY